jgi:hypothetical protein
MTRLIFAAVLLIVLIVRPIAAQDITPRQQEILMTAINTDGWLTEAMHREFWSSMPNEIRSDPKTVEAIVSMMGRASLVVARFQLEAWSSMKLSLQAKKVTKTTGYEKAKADAFSVMATAQYRSQMETNVRHAEEMIKAAATGKSVNSQRGTFYVNEEMIEQVLTGLEGTLHRFRRLTNSAWTTKVEERTYSDAHLRILWDGPFRRETKDITLENGRSARLAMLSYQISDKEYVGIGFFRIQGRWADPETAAIRVVTSSLKGMGITDVRPVASRWRGRIAAEGAGSATTSEGLIHGSVRVVEAPEHGGVWQIVGMASTSLVEATTFRVLIEQATQLDAR